ncbi:hypothetical protein GIB67_035775 [Kingdonia uniflora]|uniref:DNA helicase Pif1-like 2B domain-containing protein n=1 Tax=Kingdonia uniflora TaxID=39325 RepID=A0A7J7MJW3_9MAGN|nr:hypothetical protein GIB67_035775 [Kingdonia uniflora]
MASTASSDDPKGLEKILYLSIGARVMLRSNLATQYGLVNGAVGTAVNIVYSSSTKPPNDLPLTVMVDFDNYSGKNFCEGTIIIPIPPQNLSWKTSSEKPNYIVSSLAEKATSVPGPIVPTKEGGGVDQERLVAMLADLGQKGGMLKLVGKVALLWCGIRGAISFIEKLILFLRLTEHPLFQRILGFACMVLVMWSPVVIPLFPTLVQGSASRNSTSIAEYSCVAGHYTAVTILMG